MSPQCSLKAGKEKRRGEDEKRQMCSVSHIRLRIRKGVGGERDTERETEKVRDRERERER